MAPAPPTAPKVLIADDHPIHRMLAAAQFEALGFDVRLASDGVEAVLAAYRERFEIVVLDRHMPRWDGDHAAEAIRDPACVSRGAILVCHSSDPPTTGTGQAYDVVAPKPLSPGVLQDLVALRATVCAELHSRGVAPCETCPFGALDGPGQTTLPRADPSAAAPPNLVDFPQSFNRLRTRDLEVVCCMACGDDIDGAARYVGASPSTVRGALRRAADQLGLDSVRALRRLAQGLLGAPLTVVHDG